MTLSLRRMPAGMITEEISSMLIHIHGEWFARFSYETNYTYTGMRKSGTFITMGPVFSLAY